MDQEKKLGHLDLLYVKHGTGCITEINDHLFEGRYSPMWIDGKKHSRDVYAHTREECEEKLKVLIVEMKAELAELNRKKSEGTLPQQTPEIKKDQKKVKKAKKRITACKGAEA